MRLHFVGGIDTVTGSQLILEANGHRILRDCGLFQGPRKEARERNRNLRFDADAIDATVLSHAHIDHCGNIPTLVHSGFEGPIYATPATIALAEIMLRDAAHIQQQDAAYLNRREDRAGEEPVEPIYTIGDVVRTMRQFQGVPYGQDVEVGVGITASFIEAGHILGAALTVFTVRENGAARRVGIAVDLGRKDVPIIRDFEVMKGIDVLVIESTYGARRHADINAQGEQLRAVIRKTLARGGKVIIPSFALERAQQILYHLAILVAEGQLPEIPVYVDSPMATAVTGVFEQSWEYMDAEYLELRERIGRVMRPRWVKFVASVEESKAITASSEPCIVVAPSGMCEHGRILHHLKHGVENPKNTIAIVGFQAQRTLGRRIIERQKKIRIFGDLFDLKAKVAVLDAFSAHADRDGLIEYVRAVGPSKTFLVHGEPEQRAPLAKALRKAGLGEIHEPAAGEVVTV